MCRPAGRGASTLQVPPQRGPQILPGPGKKAFYGHGRAIQDVGDILVTLMFILVQYYGNLLVLRQQAYRPHDLLVQLFVGEFAIGAGSAVIGDAGLGAVVAAGLRELVFLLPLPRAYDVER